MEKILEKIVKQRLMKYIEKENVLSNYQSVFRKNYSCETTRSHIINEWNGDEGRKNKFIRAYT